MDSRPCHPRRPAARPLRQHGQAALILLGVLVAGSGYVLLSSLNAASLSAERAQITSDALRHAKEALIAYAVSDDNRPGSLPCPDVNNDGWSKLEDYSGSNCVSLVGRLPWRTLGLGDLRDGAGERLWYAISNDFRSNAPMSTAPGTPLNSNTTGALTVTGTLAANQVVAIVFAPGPVLIREGASTQQERGDGVCAGPPFTTTPACNPANYLDRSSGVDNADGSTAFVAADASNAFNDRLALILAEDIFPSVEIRAARELGVRLQRHYADWAGAALVTNPRGWYPWAAPFSTPNTAYAGANDQKWGLAPFSDSAVAWSSPTITDVDGSRACAINGKVLECDATAASGSFTISGRVNNVATAFIAPPDAGLVGVAYGAVAAPAASWTLNGAARALDVTVTGSFSGAGPHRITVARPGVPAWADAGAPWTSSTPHWLVKNNWHHALYYGVSEGYSIQGTAACGGGLLPLCLQVDNVTSGAHSVVVAMGRPIPARVADAGVCPSASAVGCYLEGQNAVLGPGASEGLRFEYNRRAGLFNDYASVVAGN